MQTELQKAGLRPVFFVEIGVSSGTLRLWSGYGTVNWNSQDWSGVGHLGEISPITETTEIRADSLSLKLSGIPSDYLA